MNSSMRRVADHDLRAEADAGHKPGGDQPAHIRRRRAGERGEAEDREIELIGEFAPVTVARASPRRRADQHADERRRDELRVQRHGRPAVMHEFAQHGTGEIDVETVEEHPRADEP